MSTSTIICSKLDQAGINIKNSLLKITDWVETGIYFDDEPILIDNKKRAYLVTINKDIIYSDYLADLNLDTNRFIFASRHSSEAKKPSLHIHFTGNWGPENKYGGRPFSLAISEPIGAGNALLKLFYYKEEEKELREFQVSYEVTHHGPTELNKPLFFIELGSSEKQWLLKKPADVIASVIMEILDHKLADNREVAIGFGGPHYAPSFTKYILENEDFFMGHMIPKYYIEYLNKELLKKMVERCSIRPQIALIDWKGMKSKHRKRVIELLNETDLEIEKI